MKVFRLLLGSLLLLGVATLSGCKKEKEEVKVDKRSICWDMELYSNR